MRGFTSPSKAASTTVLLSERGPSVRLGCHLGSYGGRLGAVPSRCRTVGSGSGRERASEQDPREWVLANWFWRCFDHVWRPYYTCASNCIRSRTRSRWNLICCCLSCRHICIQCDGDPTCVKVCPSGALEYMPHEQVNGALKRAAAKRISDAYAVAAQTNNPASC